jgi:hypothetical protein
MKKTELLALLATLGWEASAIATCPEGWTEEEQSEWIIVDDGQFCPDGYVEETNIRIQPSDVGSLTNDIGTYSVNGSDFCDRN